MNLGMDTMLGQWIVRWRNHRAAMAGLRELERDPQTAASIAGDLAMSLPDLKDTIAKGTGARTLMLRMMAAFGLNPDSVSRRSPRLMREIEMLCSQCTVKGRCGHELDAGTAAHTAHGFCPNAKTFEALG